MCREDGGQQPALAAAHIDHRAGVGKVIGGDDGGILAAAHLGGDAETDLVEAPRQMGRDPVRWGNVRCRRLGLVRASPVSKSVFRRAGPAAIS